VRRGEENRKRKEKVSREGNPAEADRTRIPDRGTWHGDGVRASSVKNTFLSSTQGHPCFNVQLKRGENT
jgi:hypothetical protein